MNKKMLKRSAVLGALMAFVITGSAWAEIMVNDTTLSTGILDLSNGKTVNAFEYVYNGSDKVKAGVVIDGSSGGIINGNKNSSNSNLVVSEKLDEGNEFAIFHKGGTLVINNVLLSNFAKETPKDVKDNSYGSVLWSIDDGINNSNDDVYEVKIINSVIQDNTSKKITLSYTYKDDKGKYKTKYLDCYAVVNINGKDTQITNSSFENNVGSKKGGAVNYSAGKLQIEGSTFKNNESLTDKGGAISINDVILNLYGDEKENLFENNKACVGEGTAVDNWGGALDISGAGGSIESYINFTGNNTFRNNQSKNGGAIGSKYGYELNVKNGHTLFEGNTAISGKGGAIYNTGDSGQPVLNFTGGIIEFKNNVAQCNTIGNLGEGGAIYSPSNTTVNFSGASVIFDGNQAGRRGGAIYNVGKSEYFNTEVNVTPKLYFKSGTVDFANNKAKYGGAIYNNGESGLFSYVNFDGSTVNFTNNEADGDGGAIYNDGYGIINFNGGNIEFSGNKAKGNGGAIYNNGGLLNFGSESGGDNVNVIFSANSANGKFNDIFNSQGIVNIFSNATVWLYDGITGDTGGSTTNVCGGVLAIGGDSFIEQLGGNGTIKFLKPVDLTVKTSIESNQEVLGKILLHKVDGLKFTATGEVNDAINGDASKLIDGESIDYAEGFAKEMTIEAGDISGVVTAKLGATDDGKYLTVLSQEEAPNPANEAISDTAIGMKLHWRAHVNDMNKRMGELRDANGEHGVWTRMVRGESEYKNVKVQYNQYQLGYDEKLSVDKRWIVGAAVTFSEGDASYGYGSTEDKSTAFAIYGSKLNNDGTFVDLIARYAHLESDVDDQAGKGSYSANGMSVSAEVGKRIQQGNGLWIEPQAEFTYGTVDSAEYKLGTKIVEVGDMDSLIGRVGFRIGKDIEKGNVYARASYLYDFEGETENAFRNDTARRSFNEDLGGGWWEVGVGANINLSKATYIYADVEKTFGGEVDTNWQWNLGVRYSF